MPANKYMSAQGARVSIDSDTLQQTDFTRPVAAAAGDLQAPPFFAVSLPKLLLMSVCTVGVYELYWFYRHWARIKAREQSAIAPFWRAVFAFFFCYSCFAKIRAHGKAIDTTRELPAVALAAGWVVTTLLWKLPEPWWWLSSLAVLFLLPVQAQANRVNAIAAPRHEPNAQLSGWNWSAVLLGGSFMLLALIGTFAPEQ